MAACTIATATASDTPSHWLFRSWQTDEGLPDNSVSGIAQTRDGYIWVGTRGGLLRFNGNAFTEIPLPHIEAAAGVVRMAFGDSRDRLWLGMERGRIICLERGNTRVFGPENGLPSDVVRSIIEDDQGNVWLAFPTKITRIDNGGLQHFGADEGIHPNWAKIRLAAQANGEIALLHGGKLGVFRNGEFVTLHELENPASDICASASSDLWICQGPSLRRFSNGRISNEIARLPEMAIPKVMLEDRSGALWIGTVSDGLFRFKDGRMEMIPTSHSELDCLFEDREGNLWAGTSGGGLNQVRPQVMTLIDRQAGLPSDSARSVCEDAHGAIWVAMENGQLARFEHGRWIDATRQGIEATCVAAAADGAVWVGSRGKGLHRISNGQWQSWQRSAGLAGNSVRSILAASDGKIWIASELPRRLQYLHNGIFHTLRMPPDLPVIRSIRAMAEAADGTIWIGTA
jgi:ligand-binding sensor domain-containing protein